MATPIECDIVLASTEETLGTARFHLRPRRFTVRADDVFGVALFVEAIG